MVFNSIPFVLFFVAVFFIYWFALKKTTKGQNLFLLLASWFFYGYADWRMLPLLILATVVFFFLGRRIAVAKTERQSYWWSFLGVSIGVGALLYFKYFNFFIESFALLVSKCGLHANIHSFNILMPLGISFFTFRLISYVIDIRRGVTEPTSDFVAFATYISFFPCILSGPIDRPRFIKQLQDQRSFDYDKAIDGGRQILWGLFKKAVVADNCATYVDQVWSSLGIQSGSTLLLAAVFYVFQIYADFSGYSDMAIGIGKLLGFRVMDNFKYPLFALNIADYWRRWHISLTQWLTDYVFMPLNVKFRAWGKSGMIVAILITFILIGLWHGDNWTFACFGLYHGLLYIPLILSGKFYKKTKLQVNRFGFPTLNDFGRMILTFALVTIGLILFRAESLFQAKVFLCGIPAKSLFTVPWLINRIYYIPQLLFIATMLFFEWIHRKEEHGLTLSLVRSKVLRYGVYAFLMMMIIWVGGKAETFIYFQF